MNNLLPCGFKTINPYYEIEVEFSNPRRGGEQDYHTVQVPHNEKALQDALNTITAFSKKYSGKAIVENPKDLEPGELGLYSTEYLMVYDAGASDYRILELHYFEFWDAKEYGRMRISGVMEQATTLIKNRYSYHPPELDINDDIQALLNVFDE